MEVERFWKFKRFTWPVLFFYINRYMTILGHMPVMVETFWRSTSPRKLEICQYLRSYHQFFILCIQAYIAVLLVMRIYALYGRSRRVLALYVCIFIAGIVVGAWSVWEGRDDTENAVYIMPVGCPVVILRQKAMRLATAWCMMLIFDTVVFSMTVWKSMKMYRTLSLRLNNSPSILTIMLRDGSLYFGAMMASNIANVLTLSYGTAFTKGVMATLTNIVSSILISRLMFNLRDPRLASQLTVPDKLTTIAFQYGGAPALSVEDVDWLSRDLSTREGPNEEENDLAFEESDRTPSQPNV